MISLMNYLKAIFFLFFMLLFTSQLYATTFYVDQANANASDQNPGTENSPWKTAHYGAQQLKAGDTLIIKSGKYYYNTKDNDVPGIYPRFSGTDENPIIIKAKPGDDVYLMSGPYLGCGIDEFTNPAIGNGNNNSGVGYDYIIFEGFLIYGSISIWHGNFATVKDCEMWEGGGQDSGFGCVLRMEKTTNSIIMNNVLRDNKQGSSPSSQNHPLLMEYDSSNCYIENNKFINSFAFGIRLKDNPVNIHIRNNTFTKSGVRGANQDTGSDVYIYENIFIDSNVIINNHIAGFNVYNNVFYNDIDKSDIQIRGDVSGIKIYNNIFYHTSSSTFIESWTDANFNNIDTLNYNNYYGSGNWVVDWSSVANSLTGWKNYGGKNFDTNSFDDDPLFVDAVNYEFQLQSDSPCIGRGLNGVNIGMYLNIDTTLKSPINLRIQN